MADHDGTVYASLGRRLAAYLLDLAIAASVVILALMCLMILRRVGVWAPAITQGIADPLETWKALGLNAKLLVIVAYVLSLGPIYFVLFEASPRQATFGKQLMNIYVTTDEGTRISSARAVGRWVAQFLFSYFGIGLVSIITIAATKERKGLHDIVANTVVLRGRAAPGGALEPWRVVAAVGVPFAWILGTFAATL